MLAFKRFVAKTSPIITLTESARRRIDAVLLRQGFGESGAMILGIKTGSGCKGNAYSIDFTKKPESDLVPLATKVFAKREHISALIGLELDWSEDFLESKFVFKNENATSVCACGKSFAV